MVQIKSVGVIGAGQMGTGIAHVVALGGYDVLLHDVSAERLDAGMGLIVRNMTRQVTRGIITQEAMDAGIARIKPAPELQSIGTTDLAIEAATENEETKKAIFKALAPHMSDTILLASNTSSISITRLAAANRVIEIDEVLDASRMESDMCGASALKIAFFSSSFSVAASMARSVAPMVCSSGAGLMRAMPASMASWVMIPRVTWRVMLRTIRPMPASSRSALTSCSRTS